jgi:hypothetical protein
MDIQPIRIAANFEPALLAALDTYRFSLPVVPSRAETIRAAVRALATNGASTTPSREKAPRRNGK